MTKPFAIRPLADRIIVKVLDSNDQVTAGGLVMPSSTSKFRIAEVKAVGRGIVTGNGSIVEPEVHPGDIVHISLNGGDDITIDKEKYLIIPERLIIAAVRSTSTVSKRVLTE